MFDLLKRLNIPALILPLVLVTGYFSLNGKEAVDMARLRTLNRMMPNEQDRLLTPSTIPAEDWRIFELYYRRVIDYIPSLAMGYYFLGITKYYQGNTSLAEEYLSTAVAKNEYFFWARYNLGLIHIKQEQYDQATEDFRQALALNPEISLRIMMSFQTACAVFQEMENIPQTLGGRLRQGYVDAAKFLQLLATPNVLNQESVQKQMQSLDLQIY